MSYWIGLEIDTGGEHKAEVCEPYNLTYNLNTMLLWAMGASVRGLDGTLAGGMIQLLDRAIAKMESEPETAKAYNPPNGWGDYDGALSFLKVLVNKCRENPKASIYVH